DLHPHRRRAGEADEQSHRPAIIIREVEKGGVVFAADHRLSPPTWALCAQRMAKGYYALAGRHCSGLKRSRMGGNADNDNNGPHARNCDECGSPMQLMSILPALGPFPMRRFFKCAACRAVVAETDEAAVS